MRVVMFPGQGSLKKGMGERLFDLYPKYVERADELLGYSIRELCLRDPKRQLSDTRFSQPALFVVNALHFLDDQRRGRPAPDAVLGHSLGEYSALFAAGSFDFETGLRLVKRRGQLFGAVVGGGMLAVVGLSERELVGLLRRTGREALDLANINSENEIVVSGPESALLGIEEALHGAGAVGIRLPVSGPFHSRYMADAEHAFEAVLAETEMQTPLTPVIANVTAEPYRDQELKRTLLKQITGRVRWLDSVRYLLAHGATSFDELGPGNVLTRLHAKLAVTSARLPESVQPRAASIVASSTRGETFAEAYNLKAKYMVGSVDPGITSPDLVARLARARLLGTLSVHGLSLEAMTQQVQELQARVEGATFAVGLSPNGASDGAQLAAVERLDAIGACVLELSHFLQVPVAAVLYRARGLERSSAGAIVCRNRVIARASSLEAANRFMQPAPEWLRRRLTMQGRISAEQAALLARVPLADDVCLEVETGRGMGLVTHLPLALQLRAERAARLPDGPLVRIGVGSGIVTRDAVKIAFQLGADFVQTDCFNQLAVEAATSQAVKKLMRGAGPDDVELAPDSHGFELGLQAPVLAGGIRFASRARQLWALYTRYPSLSVVPERTREAIERDWFPASFSDLADGLQTRLGIEAPPRDSQREMSLVLHEYFEHAARAATQGEPSHTHDFLVRAAPALAVFNATRDVRGHAPLHCEELAEVLLEAG